jgi:hypothetical protein
MENAMITITLVLKFATKPIKRKITLFVIGAQHCGTVAAFPICDAHGSHVYFQNLNFENSVCYLLALLKALNHIFSKGDKGF